MLGIVFHFLFVKPLQEQASWTILLFNSIYLKSCALFLLPASQHLTDTSQVNELFVFLSFVFVFMLYVAWKRGLPRKFACFVLFVQLKSILFNLFYIVNIIRKINKPFRDMHPECQTFSWLYSVWINDWHLWQTVKSKSAGSDTLSSKLSWLY